MGDTHNDKKCKTSLGSNESRLVVDQILGV